MLAYVEGSHSQQRNIEKQNHPQFFQSLLEMVDWVCPTHIANILATPRCLETV